MVCGRRAKAWFALAAALIIVGFVAFDGGLFMLRVAWAAVRNGPSALVIDSDRHDFGLVPRGPKLETRFRLTNAGGRRLLLHREDIDCPCLSSDRELTLAPGASHDLTATLHTDQFQGSIQSRIRYRTNDPRRPILELTMLAQVKPSDQELHELAAGR
jgi:hypothetical protein